MLCVKCLAQCLHVREPGAPALLTWVLREEGSPRESEWQGSQHWCLTFSGVSGPYENATFLDQSCQPGVLNLGP